MNKRSLHAEFVPAGHWGGEVPVYDDQTALEIIGRAQEVGLAVSGIEMVQPEELDRVDLPRPGILRDAERASSWVQARSFVEMLAGRGLYFAVVIESPWSTRLARVRSFARMIVHDNTSHPVER